MSEAFARYKKLMRPVLNDLSYSYATGRVRVLEASLISSEKLRNITHRLPEKGAAAESEAGERLRPVLISELGKLLDEHSYPKASDIDERIRLKSEENDRLLKELCRNDLLSFAVLLEHDFNNLKLFTKYLRNNARDFAKDRNFEVLQDSLYGEASIGPELMGRAFVCEINGEKINSSDKWLLAFMPLIRNEASSFGTNEAASVLDFRLDKLYFEALGILSGEAAEKEILSGFEKFRKAIREDRKKKSSQIYIGLYREFRADLANFQSGVRLLKRGLGRAAAERAFVSGGAVGKEKFISSFMGGIETFIESYANTAAGDLKEEALLYFSDEDRQALGIKLDEVGLSFAQIGLLQGSGAAQIAGHWQAVSYELRNLRMLNSVISAASSDRTKTRMLIGAYKDRYGQGAI